MTKTEFFQVIADAYDISDLCILPPNEVAVPYSDYIEDSDKNRFLGDTLFLFLIRELSDCESSIGEALDRLDQAIRDLQRVRRRLVELQYEKGAASPQEEERPKTQSNR